MTSAKQWFLDFLDHGGNLRHVESMLKSGSSRLLLSLDELRAFDDELTREWVFC